jgi:uncharacterized membrane protein
MEKLHGSCPWWKSPKGIVVLIALAALGVYLIVWHQQHVLGVLPFLFILLCPLMHIFMHGGHGKHEKTKESVEDNADKKEHKGGCH